jgi:putative DNA primase/helicase
VVRTDDLPETFDAADFEREGCDDPAAWLNERLIPAPEFRSDGPPPDDAAEPSAPDDDAELERLARLPPLEYGRTRKEAAKALGDIPVGILDDAVHAKRAKLGLAAEDDGRQGRPITYAEPEPWDEPVDGASLLDEIVATIARFMIMPPHGADTNALWITHAYLLDIFTVTPRLQICAPDSECGKTTLLYIISALAYRPQNAAAITPALTFRLMDRFRPTLLLDEARAVAGQRRLAANPRHRPSPLR